MKLWHVSALLAAADAPISFFIFVLVSGPARLIGALALASASILLAATAALVAGLDSTPDAVLYALPPALLAELFVLLAALEASLV